MITTAKGILRFASTSEGHRIIDHPSGPIVVDGTAGSVTMCRHRITEIPKDICQSSKIADITKAIKDEINKGALTLKEITASKILYPVLDAKKSYREGDLVRQDLALKVYKKGKFVDVKLCSKAVKDVLETKKV